MSGRSHLWSPWPRGRTVLARRCSQWTSSFWCAVSAWIGTGAPKFCLVYIPSVKGEGATREGQGPCSASYPPGGKRVINKGNGHPWEGRTSVSHRAGDKDLLAISCERTRNSEYWARVLPGHREIIQTSTGANIVCD